MAAERWARATGLSSAVVTIPQDERDNINDLIVLDWILASATNSSGQPNVIDFNGVVLGRFPGSAAGTSLLLDWPNGMPLWLLNNNDKDVVNPVSVQVGVPTATATTIVVGYHVEKPSRRRSAGQ